MGPVIECGPPPGLALRNAMISSIVTPGLILSCECIMVSIETVSPEFTLSLGGSFGSSQPHCTVSRVAASVWCLPPFCCAETGLLAASANAAISIACIVERWCGMRILSVCVLKSYPRSRPRERQARRRPALLRLDLQLPHDAAPERALALQERVDLIGRAGSLGVDSERPEPLLHLSVQEDAVEFQVHALDRCARRSRRRDHREPAAEFESPQGLGKSRRVRQLRKAAGRAHRQCAKLTALDDRRD